MAIYEVCRNSVYFLATNRDYIYEVCQNQVHFLATNRGRIYEVCRNPAHFWPQTVAIKSTIVYGNPIFMVIAISILHYGYTMDLVMQSQIP